MMDSGRCPEWKVWDDGFRAGALNGWSGMGMCPEWMVWDDGFRAGALNGWSGMMDSGQVP